MIFLGVGWGVFGGVGVGGVYPHPTPVDKFFKGLQTSVAYPHQKYFFFQEPLPPYLC